MAFTYSMVAATDTGRQRSANEDSLCILPRANLAVVADGMGGHRAGDVASRMAVRCVCDHFEEQADVNVDITMVSEAVSLANRQVYTNARTLSGCEGMGTTLVMASFQPEKVHVGHVGDSRMYRFHRGELTQLTTDHTLATELVSPGGSGKVPDYAHHVLSRALGIESVVEPDLLTFTPEHGSLYLLCSDGLTAAISDPDITTILALRAHEPEHCAEALVNACLDNGAPDNVSLVLVSCSGTG